MYAVGVELDVPLGQVEVDRAALAPAAVERRHQLVEIGEQRQHGAVLARRRAAAPPRSPAAPRRRSAAGRCRSPSRRSGGGAPAVAADVEERRDREPRHPRAERAEAVRERLGEHRHRPAPGSRRWCRGGRPRGRARRRERRSGRRRRCGRRAGSRRRSGSTETASSKSRALAPSIVTTVRSRRSRRPARSRGRGSAGSAAASASAASGNSERDPVVAEHDLGVDPRPRGVAEHLDHPRALRRPARGPPHRLGDHEVPLGDPVGAVEVQLGLARVVGGEPGPAVVDGDGSDDGRSRGRLRLGRRPARDRSPRSLRRPGPWLGRGTLGRRRRGRFGGPFRGRGPRSPGGTFGALVREHRHHRPLLEIPAGDQPAPPAERPDQHPVAPPRAGQGIGADRQLLVAGSNRHAAAGEPALDRPGEPAGGLRGGPALAPGGRQAGRPQPFERPVDLLGGGSPTRCRGQLGTPQAARARSPEPVGQAPAQLVQAVRPATSGASRPPLSSGSFD